MNLSEPKVDFDQKEWMNNQLLKLQYELLQT